MTASTMIAWPAAKRSVARKAAFGVLLCAFLALGGALYLRRPKPVSVRVVSPEYQDIESTVSASGQVVPVHDFQARANFSGIVDKIYVKLGQKVRAGQMLVEMRDQFATSRIATARADLRSAEVNLDNVQHNGSQEDRIGYAEALTRAQAERDSAANALVTLQKLLQRGSVSEGEVHAGEQRLQVANAALDSLNQRMQHRYSQADIASWRARVAADRNEVAAERVSYGNANIASPMDGTVYTLPVLQYDYVPAGAELLHVADLSQLEVRAQFAESDIGKLYVGQPVKIAWEGSPGRTWSGHIVVKPLAVTRSGIVGQGTSTIALDDPRSDIPLNSNVTATVLVEKHAHVLTVPRAALYSQGQSNFIYKIVDGRLKETPVEVGVLNAFRAEVTTGLSAKDTIALNATGDEQLRNNLRVQAAD
jgi:HlyD family secretion protein